MALERSVNRESNAFIGSILDGVVRMEGDGAAGAEAAFTLGVGWRRKATSAQPTEDPGVRDLWGLEPSEWGTNIKLP